MPLSKISNPFLDPAGSARSNVYSPSANTIGIVTSGIDRVRVNSSGNMGVGTTSPQATIHSTKAGAEVARFTNSNSNGGDWEFKIGGGGFEDRKFMITDKFSGADNVRVNIDSAGRVTKPFHPYFVADRTGNQTGFNASSTADVVVVYNNTTDNVGSHFNTSTGKFTAPIAGVYAFQASAYLNFNSGQSWLVLNGNRAGYADWSFGTTGAFTHGFWVIKLSANDSVGYHPYSASETNGTIFSSANHTYFKGYLLG